MKSRERATLTLLVVASIQFSLIQFSLVQNLQIPVEYYLEY